MIPRNNRGTDGRWQGHTRSDQRVTPHIEEFLPPLCPQPGAIQIQQRHQNFPDRGVDRLHGGGGIPLGAPHGFGDHGVHQPQAAQIVGGQAQGFDHEEPEEHTEMFSLQGELLASWQTITP